MKKVADMGLEKSNGCLRFSSNPNLETRRMAWLSGTQELGNRSAGILQGSFLIS
jgi:hypothetical protein